MRRNLPVLQRNAEPDRKMKMLLNGKGPDRKKRRTPARKDANRGIRPSFLL
jgi:hypothetical protein